MTNNDLTNLQHSWQQFGTARSADNSTDDRTLGLIRHRMASRMTSRLTRRFRILTIVGLLVIGMGLRMDRCFPSSTLVQVSYTAFGFIATCVSFFLLLQIRRTRMYFTLPCIEAARLIARLNRQRIILSNVLTVLAFLVIMLLLYELLLVDAYLFIAGCVGGAIGLVIDIVINVKNARDFRRLIASFAEPDKTTD